MCVCAVVKAKTPLKTVVAKQSSRAQFLLSQDVFYDNMHMCTQVTLYIYCGVLIVVVLFD